MSAHACATASAPFSRVRRPRRGSRRAVRCRRRAGRRAAVPRNAPVRGYYATAAVLAALPGLSRPGRGPEPSAGRVSRSTPAATCCPFVADHHRPAPTGALARPGTPTPAADPRTPRSSRHPPTAAAPSAPPGRGTPPRTRPSAVSANNRPAPGASRSPVLFLTARCQHSAEHVNGHVHPPGHLLQAVRLDHRADQRAMPAMRSPAR